MVLEDAVIQRMIRWGQEQHAVRAMLLTGSRANCADDLSDYDIILVVEDIHPFYEDKNWLEGFGRVLVAYWDPIHPAPDYDIAQLGNVVLFQDGLKVDFTVWPVELLRQIVQSPALPADLDLGYVVLMDKDRLTEGLSAPTYSATIPSPPSEAVYQKVVADFFSDVPFVAKCLRRDELLPAKYCLDFDMKHNFLRQMLDWRMELDHGWSAPTGFLGRGLKKRLPPEIWSQVESTYAGAGIEENWEAFFRTLALFRWVGIEVASQLGYTYPLDMDRRVAAYAQQVRDQTPT
ncbi:MAG: aminoglycoside 6-adenylyltransferase [Anaerolineae bacterium]|nr:aminoglycoside 6-adenylyltransferase [Anaerolineae bacterium]